ncbi:MAG: transglutaminase-like domain-containing protein [Kofleriaceae bacterium]
MTAAERLSVALAHHPARLDLAALAIAELDDDPAEPTEVLALLDRWGAQVAARARGSAYAGLDALEGLLVGQLALEGDRDDYDHPHNSFLPRVVARRRGLPIALAVIYLEVARRADLPLFGVALPGHFVVAYRMGETATVVIDPFERARLLDRTDLVAMVARAGARWSPSLLTPATPLEIARRMLRNLVGSYHRRGDHAKLAAAMALLEAIAQDPALMN